MRIFAIVFLIAGVAGQAYGKIQYGHVQNQYRSEDGLCFIDGNSSSVLLSDCLFGIEPEDFSEEDDNFESGQWQDLEAGSDCVRLHFEAVAKSASGNFVSGIVLRHKISLVVLHHSWKSFLV